MRVKRLGVTIVSLLSAMMLFGCRVYPPKDREVIAKFQAHRDVYERLVAMLQEDKQVIRVASWGVSIKPGDPDLQRDRYQEYVALLREVEGIGANRSKQEGLADMFSIGVWVYGAADNRRHIDICWLKDEPLNQVANLDDFYRTPKPRSPVYRHIEGHWYLWADW